MELLVPYRVYRMLAGTDDYCSKPLEHIVESSFASDPRYAYQGKLPKARPLDAVYLFEGKTRLGVEVKNIREWIYPMSGEVWVMIRKCLELDAVPFLIPRKLAYLTHAAFSRLGIMGFEFHRQIFAPQVAYLLPDIQHTDRLGYKDVVALPPQPYGPLCFFIQTALPAHLPRYKATWESKRRLLEEFAIERRLGDPNMKDADREQHRDEFLHRVFGEEEATPASRDEPSLDLQADVLLKLSRHHDTSGTTPASAGSTGFLAAGLMHGARRPHLKCESRST